MVELFAGLLVAVAFAGVGLAVLPRPRWADAAPPERRPPLAGLAPGLGAALPVTRRGRLARQAALHAAGEYRPGAADAAAAWQLLLAGSVLVTALLVSLFAPAEFGWAVIGVGLGLAAVAYLLPTVYLSGRERRRREAVEAGLPLALDLLAVALAAAADVRGGFALVARAVRRPYPVLADELALVGRQADLFSLGYAVRQWADRGRVPAVKELARTVARAESTGSGLAAAVAAQAADLRAAARLRAEAAGNRLAFWLLLPTLLCFWSATAILLVSPAAAQLADYRRTSGVEAVRAELAAGADAP